MLSTHPAPVLLGQPNVGISSPQFCLTAQRNNEEQQSAGIQQRSTQVCEYGTDATRRQHLDNGDGRLLLYIQAGPDAGTSSLYTRWNYTLFGAGTNMTNADRLLRKGCTRVFRGVFRSSHNSKRTRVHAGERLGTCT